jgi:hypothetical protein
MMAAALTAAVIIPLIRALPADLGKPAQDLGKITINADSIAIS